VTLVDLTLLLHGLATCLMAGLCWCVQVVHYPMMGRVPGEMLKQYAAEHARRITWFVAPVMLIEAVTAGLLLLMAVAGQNLGSEWAWGWGGGGGVGVGAGGLARVGGHGRAGGDLGEHVWGFGAAAWKVADDGGCVGGWEVGEAQLGAHGVVDGAGGVGVDGVGGGRVNTLVWTRSTA
jgi:hypothetical protein